MGIYKKKQESKKKERKHALDQEKNKETRFRPRKPSRKNDNGQEKKKTRSRPRIRPRKKILSFFLLSCFLLYIHTSVQFCFSVTGGVYSVAELTRLRQVQLWKWRRHLNDVTTWASIDVLFFPVPFTGWWYYI